jgi:hypothetical protein
MSPYTLSFEVVQQNGGVFWVKCKEMKFSSYTTDLTKLMGELVEEWVDLNSEDWFINNQTKVLTEPIN